MKRGYQKTGSALYAGSNPTGGKGDTPRKVNKKKFDENWDKIFGKKDDQ